MSFFGPMGYKHANCPTCTCDKCNKLDAVAPTGEVGKTDAIVYNVPQSVIDTLEWYASDTGPNGNNARWALEKIGHKK